MERRSVRLILGGGIFEETAEGEAWYDRVVAVLVATAESRLALAAGGDYDLLAASARMDQSRTLARFLARLLLLRPRKEFLQQTIDLWVDAQHEMLSRLRADWAAILEWGRGSSPGGKVIQIEGELSDRHDGGRSAAILTFEAGWKLVYKPRAMEADGWYSQLLAWLNASEAPVSFLNPRVAVRDGYGWMEFVAHQRCGSREQFAEYYRNSGGLLCLLHLLRATDCHFQNLIACGVHPVLVDAEMLFQPSLQAFGAWTVTDTGLIPNFRFGPGGQTYDVSGLGFVRPQSTHFEVPEWNESGVEFRACRLRPNKNVPCIETEDLEDEEARPYFFAAEMEDGFLQMHRFVEQRQEAFLKQIEKARKLRIRYLLRETMEYYAAWNGEAGASVSLGELQSSHRVFSELRAEELSALRQLDVPRFAMAADSRDLHGIQDCFALSGHELVCSGIRELGEQSLAQKIGQMRVAWAFSRIASSLA